MKTLLPPIQTQDEIAWFPARDGLFSTKNRYWFSYFISELNSPTEASSSSLNDFRKTWKIIWNANIMPKLSTWTWQAIHHRLSSVVELKKRNLTHFDLCLYCCVAQETFFHIFYDCAITKITRTLIKTNPITTDSSVALLDLCGSLVQSKGYNIFWIEVLICWRMETMNNKKS